MKGWYLNSGTDGSGAGQQREPDPSCWSLSDQVARLSSDVDLALRDLCDGVLILGGNGSGKSSTSGRLLFESMLSRGAGAVFLTVKDSDPADYIRYAESVGRGSDVVRFAPGGSHRINLIETAAAQGGTEAVVKMLSVAMRIVESGRAEAHGGDPIWDRARDVLTRNLCDLVHAAGEPLSLEVMANVLDSAPTDLAAAAAVLELAERREPCLDGTKKLSDFERCYIKASAQSRAGNSPVDVYTAKATARYWTGEYPTVPDRTRGSVRFGFDAMLGALTRGQIAHLCTTETTLPLSVLREGKIVILDLPVRRYGESARIVQAIFKHLVQNELEREAIDADSEVRPVLIGLDEAQEFLSDTDVAFQATARSARACTVMISQSVAGMRRALGRDGTEKLLGVLGTKIVHACDGETASWMADLIGQDWRFSPTIGDRGSVSLSRAKRHLIEPIAFSHLARGGPEFNYCSEAYVFKSGARWGPRERNFARVTLHQNRGGRNVVR